MTDLELACTDLARALEVLEKVGLRIEMIVPADDPQVAIVTRDGVRIRVSRTGATLPGRLPPLAPTAVIARSGPWHAGRAGMLYRDLIPGRQGGHVIASHIRIPEGGPVPDYVHYHAIWFQMIYCHRGWVRLVYEDQGEPFTMDAGDCVLQPPLIRHRVLESSPGLEVIEVGSPAVHATYVDHDLTLPTAHVRPDREFSGQRYVLVRGLAANPQAIHAATGGIASACVRTTAEPVTPAGALYFGVVLRGGLEVGRERLGAEDAFVLPPGQLGHLGAATPDLAWLEVQILRADPDPPAVLAG